MILVKTSFTTKEESDMKHPLWIERHTSNSFMSMRAAEAPCVLIPIIPNYAHSTELPIIPETMPSY